MEVHPELYRRVLLTIWTTQLSPPLRKRFVELLVELLLPVTESLAFVSEGLLTHLRKIQEARDADLRIVYCLILVLELIWFNCFDFRLILFEVFSHIYVSSLCACLLLCRRLFKWIF